MSIDLVVIRTGVANLASVVAGLRRAGGDPTLTSDPARVRDASHVMLPGVGTFGAAMQVLNETGLAEALTERIQRDQPTMAICVGLQVLARTSTESPGVAGLGVLDAQVTRFEDTVLVPQLGWNQVTPDDACRLLQPGYAYFANSYRLAETPRDCAVATTDHGGPFVSALERGALLACQFHPELSGRWGHDLLTSWLARHGAGRSPRPAGAGASASFTHQTKGRVLPRCKSLTVRIIPCLDVRDGKVVKGIRFQGLKEAGDPAERSLAYQTQGADEIVLLDVSATPEGRGNAVETVKAVRAVLSIPLTVGGGIRRVEDAGRLLDAGADKVSVNSAAVADPSLINRLAERFGSQCTVIAVDAARRAEGDGWEVVVHSGKDRTGMDAIAWAKEVVSRGCGEILLTSWDRDGTKSGYDLALLTAVSDVVNVPVIASGGAAHPEHLVEALEAGASAVLAASIFHYGEYTVGDVKTVLANHGIEVRP